MCHLLFSTLPSKSSSSRGVHLKRYAIGHRKVSMLTWWHWRYHRMINARQLLRLHYLSCIMAYLQPNPGLLLGLHHLLLRLHHLLSRLHCLLIGVHRLLLLLGMHRFLLRLRLSCLLLGLCHELRLHHLLRLHQLCHLLCICLQVLKTKKRFSITTYNDFFAAHAKCQVILRLSSPLIMSKKPRRQKCKSLWMEKNTIVWWLGGVPASQSQ